MYNIHKNNLLIREIGAADIELIRKWRNQNYIKKRFINTGDISKLQQMQWFKNYLKKTDDMMFMIEETDIFKTKIGTVALYNINTDKRSVELGRLMIGYAPAQRKGFGKQAVILTCLYALNILKSTDIYLTVLNDNIPAIKLYKQIGFVITNMHSDILHMSLDKKAFLIHSQLKEP